MSKDCVPADPATVNAQQAMHGLHSLHKLVLNRLWTHYILLPLVVSDARIVQGQALTACDFGGFEGRSGP